MSRIEWYILRRTAIVTFGTLISTTTIVLITQILIRVDLLSSTGQSLLVFGKLALYLVPSVAVIVIPFALLIGASQTLSGMNGDSELVVIEASGCSRKIVARPLIMFGLLLSIFAFFLGNIVEPLSNRSIRELVTAAKADLISVAVQSGSFTKIDDDLIIQIERKERDGTFTGVFLSDRRSKESELLYFAKSGAITKVDDAELFVLRDGQLQRTDMKTGDISVISFDLNALDLAAFGANGKNTLYYPKDRSTYDLIAPDPDDRLFKSNPGSLRTELNKRLSEWLYVITFVVLVVFYLGKARSHRQSSILASVYLGLVVMGVRGSGAFATNNSGNGGFWEWLVYGVPFGVILFFGTLVFFDKDIPDPQRTLDYARKILRRMGVYTPHWLVKGLQYFRKNKVSA